MDSKLHFCSSNAQKTTKIHFFDRQNSLPKFRFCKCLSDPCVLPAGAWRCFSSFCPTWDWDSDAGTLRNVIIISFSEMREPGFGTESRFFLGEKWFWQFRFFLKFFSIFNRVSFSSPMHSTGRLYAIRPERSVRTRFGTVKPDLRGFRNANSRFEIEQLHTQKPVLKIDQFVLECENSPDGRIFDFPRNFEDYFRAFERSKRIKMCPKWTLNAISVLQTPWKRIKSSF